MRCHVCTLAGSKAGKGRAKIFDDQWSKKEKALWRNVFHPDILSFCLSLSHPPLLSHCGEWTQSMHPESSGEGLDSVACCVYEQAAHQWRTFKTDYSGCPQAIPLCLCMCLCVYVREGEHTCVQAQVLTCLCVCVCVFMYVPIIIKGNRLAACLGKQVRHQT